MKIYKATIVPTVAGGNIEVKVSANSVSQAIGIIKTLPYFKSLVRQPVQEGRLKFIICGIHSFFMIYLMPEVNVWEVATKKQFHIQI